VPELAVNAIWWLLLFLRLQHHVQVLLPRPAMLKLLPIFLVHKTAAAAASSTASPAAAA
jgi:hypothetical protein